MGKIEKIYRICTGLEKKLNELGREIGPVKCLIGGSAMLAVDLYFRYYKGIFIEGLCNGNVWRTTAYCILTIPPAAASDILLSSGICTIKDDVKSYAKKTVKSMQKNMRAKRLYNAWKTCPSMAYSAINA
jgi:hypothetical protein